MVKKNSKKHELILEDSNALKSLEKELKLKLNEINAFSIDNGFVTENNAIIELNLHNLGLSNFPESIKLFSNLKELRYDNNNLENIDFSPLSLLPNIRYLDLDQNLLSTIDLSPLAKCENLEVLSLEDNKIRTIDLSPLSLNKNLKNLGLRQNQIVRIELKSLKNCEKLERVDLGRNKIQEIDLSPLKENNRLKSLNLENNRLKTLNLNFLKENTTFKGLMLHGNPIKQLDLTPLLHLLEFTTITIDQETRLIADPVHRDHSVDQSWFTSKYLPRIQWRLSDKDQTHQALYDRYIHIMRHFIHEEFWADYRDRRVANPPQYGSGAWFFEFAVQCYLKIKDRACSQLSTEKQEERLRDLETRFQDYFLTVEEFRPLLQAYFEPRYESTITVERLPSESSPPELVIFRYWPDFIPIARRVRSITWAKIQPDPSNNTYQVRLGFNRGFLKDGATFHPYYPTWGRPLPDDWDKEWDGEEQEPLEQGAFPSVEASYQVEVFSEPDLLVLLTRLRQWLAHAYAPCYSDLNRNFIIDGLRSEY